MRQKIRKRTDPLSGRSSNGFTRFSEVKMLTFRQLSAVVWTFLGFMMAAALVLNLRYKPMAGDALLLDTWTGRLHSVSAEQVPEARTVDAFAVARRRDAIEIRIVERLVETGRARPVCTSARFAFPAPNSP